MVNVLIPPASPNQHLSVEFTYAEPPRSEEFVREYTPVLCVLQYVSLPVSIGASWNLQPSIPLSNVSLKGTAAYTVTVNVCESECMPSDTVTLMECMPFCDSVGAQVSTPVVLCMITPVGGSVMPYVRLFAGMSASVAVMFSVSLDRSCIV